MGDRFETPEEMLREKWGPHVVRLRKQRDRLGGASPPTLIVQLFTAEEVVKDLEALTGLRADLVVKD